MAARSSSGVCGAPIIFSGLDTQSRKTIFKQDFSFSEMGIGGLDKEFSVRCRLSLLSDRPSLARSDRTSVCQSAR